MLHLRPVPRSLFVAQPPMTGPLLLGNDGGVHHGDYRNPKPVLSKVLSDQYKKPLPKVVSLKDMTELAEGGLVRCGLTAKVYADKVAHGAGVVKRLLNRRVGGVEPVLKKMNAEHAFDPDRRASGTLGFWDVEFVL